jgi:ankyrin repeat protein
VVSFRLWFLGTAGPPVSWLVYPTDKLHVHTKSEAVAKALRNQIVGHGADVNARSSDMRTPLMIAARRPSNAATVKLLLERGANPNPNAHPLTESSPLIEAATAGDAASMELLLGRGAEVKEAGEPALEMAVTMRCSKCVALLAAKDLTKQDYSQGLAMWKSSWRRSRACS